MIRYLELDDQGKIKVIVGVCKAKDFKKQGGIYDTTNKPGGL